jgi:hypothetical protein
VRPRNILTGTVFKPIESFPLEKEQRKGNAMHIERNRIVEDEVPEKKNL